jgi:hypothetical protein
MPNYRFEIVDGLKPPEVIEVELGGLTEAKCEAVMFAGRVLCDTAGTFWDNKDWTLTVATDDHLTLFELLIHGTEAPAAVSV